MGRRWIGITILFTFSFLADSARADDPPPAATSAGEKARTPMPWDRLGANAYDSYVGWTTLFHAAGISVTGAMAPSGGDYEVHKFFSRNREAGYIGAPALLLGYIAPVAVVGGLYLYGWRAESNTAIGAGSAVLQSLAFSLVHTTILKVITGRPSPHDADDSSAGPRETSGTFRFGFNRGGFIKGWPSGHTGAAVAIGVTLAAYYDVWWIDILGYASVAYMGYSMIAYNGGYHWASDVAAAAFMNFPIARTVGKSFRALVRKEKPSQAAAFSIVPTMLYDGAAALTIGGAF